MIKNKSQKKTFIVVGLINTAIDFSILFLLRAFGLPAISANIISTTVAFCFSFFANKKYTFKTTGGDIKREIVLFILVTLFGLWVIQTFIIAVVTGLLSGVSLPENLVLFIAKLFAVFGSLTWNYTMYSHLVFKDKNGA